jgi:hypothetical protein
MWHSLLIYVSLCLPVVCLPLGLHYSRLVVCAVNDFLNGSSHATCCIKPADTVDPRYSRFIDQKLSACYPNSEWVCASDVLRRDLTVRICG